MRMMPVGGGQWTQEESCPLSSRLYAPSFTERICSRLRPLVAGLRPFPRVNVLPKRHVGRCGLALCIATVLFFLVVTYLSPAHRGSGAWFYGIGTGRGPGGREVCPLICPQISASDGRWKPRVTPASHACKMTVASPVPCPANKTTSKLLQMPPIHFLSNFKTPCWYDPLPKDPDAAGNIYQHNLYNCFSEGTRKVATSLSVVWTARAQTERDPKRLRCLPYFYIAGMPKSGSTDLFRKVTLHPDVVRTPMKEPHWWARNKFGQRLNYSSLIPLSDYVDLFDRAALQIESRTLHSPTASEEDSRDTVYDHDIAETTQDTESLFHHVITGDASASTFWSNDNWARLAENCGRDEPLFTNAHYIRRLTPDSKIIVIFRNPTERLYSDYLYFHKDNKSVEMFHQEVLTSIDKFQACLSQRSLRACVYDKHVSNGAKVRLRIGLYHVYLEEWLKVFPPEQLLVIRTEDYAKNLRHHVRKVYRFLGLRELPPEEEDRIVELPRANTRKMKDLKLGPMLSETRRILRDFHRPYNQRLAQLLDDHKYLWDDVTEDMSRGPTKQSVSNIDPEGGPKNAGAQNSDTLSDEGGILRHPNDDIGASDVSVLRHRKDDVGAIDNSAVHKTDDETFDNDERGQERTRTRGRTREDEDGGEDDEEVNTVSTTEVTEEYENEEENGDEDYYDKVDADSGYDEYEDDNAEEDKERN